jgi:hypothetical protein
MTTQPNNQGIETDQNLQHCPFNVHYTQCKIALWSQPAAPKMAALGYANGGKWPYFLLYLKSSGLRGEAGMSSETGGWETSLFTIKLQKK